MSQLNVGKVVAGVGVELPTLAESNRPTASSGLMFFNSDKNRVEIHSGADWYVLNTLSSQTFGTVKVLHILVPINNSQFLMIQEI